MENKKIIIKRNNKQLKIMKIPGANPVKKNKTHDQKREYKIRNHKVIQMTKGTNGFKTRITNQMIAAQQEFNRNLMKL